VRQDKTEAHPYDAAFIMGPTMTPDSVLDWAKALSILGAIIFGGFAVFSPSWVWFRIQNFKMGSALLLGFGTVLLVSPLFRNINFTVDTQKFELKLSALEQQILQTRTQIASLTQEVNTLPAVFAANTKSIGNTAQTLQASIATIENELPRIAALREQIAKVEQSVASVESGIKTLGQQTTLLASANHSMLPYTIVLDDAAKKKLKAGNLAAWAHYTSQMTPVAGMADYGQYQNFIKSLNQQSLEKANAETGEPGESTADKPADPPG